MPIDLYHHPASGPCRAVRLVAAAVGVELNLKLTDILAKDHLKPEFLKVRRIFNANASTRKIKFNIHNREYLYFMLSY